MTEYTSADVQRLQTHSGPGNIRNSPNQYVPAHRPTLLTTTPSDRVIDLTEDPATLDVNPHPAKRRRLEDTANDAPALNSQHDSADTTTRRFASLLRRNGLLLPPMSFADQLAQAGHGVDSTTGIGSSNSRPPPLPKRPWKPRVSQEDRAPRVKTTQGARSYGEVLAVPFKIGVPEQAPKYHEDKVADFFPWTGNHPEDVLSEQAAKHGYYDRQISQNETSTARPSLYSVFKHKSGLDTLSSLFLRVVEQRQVHGKITAASSFKPPPRVTLTEAKRKTWLSDLADSNVPLRKLSRTIPQGIRGQHLLEQSLINSIPIGRAIWFAKCVGANEIRTLKRNKGTNGTFAAGAELKWLKEWTVGAEHFLEAIITTCGQDDWKTRITYGMNLVVRLYTENMLDKDHFVEWVASSIAKSTLDMLPFWLVSSRIFLNDLIQLRKQGRLFSTALLQQLNTARDLDTEDFNRLIGSLSQLVRVSARTRPLLFLISDVWDEYQMTLNSCLDPGTPSDRVLYRELAESNQRLRRFKDDSVLKMLSPRQTITRLLDAAKAPFDIPRLSNDCITFCEDSYERVRTVLEWSSTPFRVASARKYLAVNLLRRWHINGVDIESPVRDLFTGHIAPRVEKSAFFHVLADLIRSRSISVSRCLQWALATSSVNSGRSKSAPDILQLIREAPMIHVPNHIRNLRSSILDRAGFSQSSAEQQCVDIKRTLSDRIPSLLGPLDADNSSYPPTDFDLSLQSQSIRFEISHWVSEAVANHYRELPIPGKDESQEEKHDVCAFTADELQHIRAILEELDDMPILADILSHACNSDDEIVLALAAETINAHSDDFSAIGSLSSLYSLLCDTYKELRSSPAILRNFAIALLNLAHKLPPETTNLKQLLDDLARGDRSIAISACSPISDHMAETLQQAGSTFADEFDQLLSTGNSMDDQTMARLFYALTERIESCSEASKTDKINLCQMVLRLLAFRPKHFDELLLNWLRRLLQGTDDASLITIEYLIGSGVTSMQNVISASEEFILHQPFAEASNDMYTVRQNLTRLIEMSVPPGRALQDPVIYRLQYSRAQCLADPSPEITSILSALRDASNPDNSAPYERSHDGWQERCTITSLISRPNDAQESTGTISTAEAKTIGYLLDISTPPEMASISTISGMILSNDRFSLPLRQAYLKHVYDRAQYRQGSDSVTQEQILNLVTDLALDFSNGEDASWTTYVSCLGFAAAQHIRQYAEDAFFAAPPPFGTNQTRSDGTSQPSRDVMITIIEKTAFTIPESGLHATASLIVDRFAGLLRYISTSTQAQNQEETNNPTLWSEDLQVHLCHLLRLATFHRPSFVPSPHTQATNQAQSQLQIRLLLFLTSLALHPSLSAVKTTISPVNTASDSSSEPIPIPTYAFDVLATLSDDLPEESRLVLNKHLKDRMRDPRARFLFGSLNDQMSEDLTISKDPSTGNSTGGAKEVMSTEYKVKNWELVQGIYSGRGAGEGNDTSLSLSLFGGRVSSGKTY